MPVASRVRGTPVPQLAELLDKEDDWSGVTDAASRRRLQNRLNVRAYRRRKALMLSQQHSESSPEHIKTEEEIPFWDEKNQSVCLRPASMASRMKKYRGSIIPISYASGLARTPQDGVLFPLSSDHLIILLQYNVLRACLANHELIAPLGSAAVAECESAAEHVVPYPVNTGLVPPPLLPTALQSTIPHEGWADIIPHPAWRDNILLALGHFDEDALWSDVMGGLFEGFPESEVEHRGVIAWDPPWDASGWELSEGVNNWQPPLGSTLPSRFTPRTNYFPSLLMPLPSPLFSLFSFLSPSLLVLITVIVLFIVLLLQPSCYGIMRHPTLPDFTLVCQGQQFRLHKDKVCEKSPVLREDLERIFRELQSFVIHVTEFNAITVNHMVEFFYHDSYQVNESTLPSYALAKPIMDSGGARPKAFVQDFLICHIEVNAIGMRYEIPSLCELSVRFIAQILREDWHDSIFLGVAAVVASRSTDQNLHDMLCSFARAHLESLAKLPEFKESTMFEGLVCSASLEDTIDTTDVVDTPDTSTTIDIADSIGATDNHAQHDEVTPLHAWTSTDHALMKEEFDRLNAQVASLEEQVSAVSSERDLLQGRVRMEESQVAASALKFQLLERRIKAEEIKVAQSALKLEQSTRTLHVCQADTTTAARERDLYRARWEKEQKRSSSLAEKCSELEQALELEKKKKSPDASFDAEKAENALLVVEGKLARITSDRDRLNEAFEKEKKTSATLKREFEAEKDKQTGMSLAERDRLQRAIGAETNKVVTITRERDEAKRAETTARTRENEAKRAEIAAKNRPVASDKINDLIRKANQYDKCRHCGEDFDDDDATWVHDVGDEILLRCSECKTRHY
ncbi:hypothetical protein FSARC_12698 [Fusarium sarcochroum]|uniref:BTB domain-containing protein n=1 Tax=Fusarium sarcochroum TaxID=1208366 RepID=A0A8H4WVE8_9HYPO|nr:hypothetical protein FSARC_12698 [Fusarium sarcochroum]